MNFLVAEEFRTYVRTAWFTWIPGQRNTFDLDWIQMRKKTRAWLN